MEKEQMNKLIQYATVRLNIDSRADIAQELHIFLPNISITNKGIKNEWGYYWLCAKRAIAKIHKVDGEQQSYRINNGGISEKEMMDYMINKEGKDKIIKKDIIAKSGAWESVENLYLNQGQEFYKTEEVLTGKKYQKVYRWDKVKPKHYEQCESLIEWEIEESEIKTWIEQSSIKEIQMNWAKYYPENSRRC